MASITNVAAYVRPRFVGMLLLMIAVVPWRNHGHGRQLHEMSGVASSLPRFIDVPIAPSIDVIKPPPLADAAEWPRGMVIHPPAIDGSILQWKHSPLDNVLSVFIAPFRALGA